LFPHTTSLHRQTTAAAATIPHIKPHDSDIERDRIAICHHPPRPWLTSKVSNQDDHTLSLVSLVPRPVGGRMPLPPATTSDDRSCSFPPPASQSPRGSPLGRWAVGGKRTAASRGVNDDKSDVSESWLRPPARGLSVPSVELSLPRTNGPPIKKKKNTPKPPLDIVRRGSPSWESKREDHHRHLHLLPHHRLSPNHLPAVSSPPSTLFPPALSPNAA
jgi:hypothetical protein